MADQNYSLNLANSFYSRLGQPVGDTCVSGQGLNYLLISSVAHYKSSNQCSYSWRIAYLTSDSVRCSLNSFNVAFNWITAWVPEQSGMNLLIEKPEFPRLTEVFDEEGYRGKLKSWTNKHLKYDPEAVKTNSRLSNKKIMISPKR